MKTEHPARQDFTPVTSSASTENSSAEDFPCSRAGRIDLAAIRAKLAAKGQEEYWRSLEELAGTAEFQAFVENEFPARAGEFSDPVSRRNFLKLMSGSLALAGLDACTRQPLEKIVPYVEQPELIVPGKPLFFATAMPLGESAVGLLVESREGRPIKVEGNPDHPASLGATSVFHQAALLDLYDPDRARAVTQAGNVSTWNAFLAALNDQLKGQQARRGAGLRILTGALSSPTFAAQLEQLQQKYPEAKWIQYEPISRDSVRDASRIAFHETLDCIYDFSKADIILSLSSDFLFNEPGSLRYARQFADGRRVTAGEQKMNRLYVVEPTPTITGAAAGHRLPLGPSQIGLFAAVLARELGVVQLENKIDVDEKNHIWLRAVARDLQQHRGSGLIIAGPEQPVVTHVLAHLINDALGNVGKTVFHVPSIGAQKESQITGLQRLAEEMDSGMVELLVIAGANPAYTAPVDFRFAERMGKVKFRVQLSSYHDETTVQCHWHIPESHFLEAWSDVRAFDGTISIGSAPGIGAMVNSISLSRAAISP